MSLQFNNIQVSVNGLPILAETAAINEQNSVVPN